VCVRWLAETTFSNLFSLKNDSGLTEAYRSFVALQKKGLLPLSLSLSLSLSHTHTHTFRQENNLRHQLGGGVQKTLFLQVSGSSINDVTRCRCQVCTFSEWHHLWRCFQIISFSLKYFARRMVFSLKRINAWLKPQLCDLLLFVLFQNFWKEIMKILRMWLGCGKFI
jgi:hypothetical protein